MFEHVRAFLFDFDGTLIQQQIDFGLMRRVVLDIVQAYQVPSEAVAGMHVLEAISRVAEALAASDARRGASFAEEARRAVTRIEVDAAEGACAFPGTQELLEYLGARGIGVAIVTRNCRVAVEHVLARNPMHYDVLLTRDDVVQVKPDPRHLLAALEVLQVPGQDAVMCGDHPMDVLAGRGVGAATVGILPPGQGSAYFAQVQPDLIVSGVAELRGCIDRAHVSG